MFCASNPKANPDVVQCVIADVGQPPPDLLAAIVATSTIHTAVISQKRENKKTKAEVTKWRRQPLKLFARMVSWFREEWKPFFRFPRYNYQKCGRPGPHGMDPGFPGRAGPAHSVRNTLENM